MDLFKKKEDCCGCGACQAACPSSAISMKRDEEGFAYPSVDAVLCTGCGLCARVCPVQNPGGSGCDNTYLGAKAKEDSLRFASSSGGVFPLLARPVLEQGGAVYGAAFGEGMAVLHKAAVDWEGLQALRRTKYVQSNLEGIFQEVKKRLEQGQPVLFSGTPCQVRGLGLFLGRDYPNLILVDLVCHGTPSPGLWEAYVKDLERRHGPLTAYDFRDKRKKDSGHTRSYTAGGKERACPLGGDVFLRPFLAGASLRPACYQCRFCTPLRESDFTLGDFWGVEKVRPQADDGMGVSMVILHNDRARAYWERVKEGVECFACQREDVLQPRLRGPAPSDQRGAFLAACRFLGLLGGAKAFHLLLLFQGGLARLGLRRR